MSQKLFSFFCRNSVDSGIRINPPQRRIGANTKWGRDSNSRWHGKGHDVTINE